ncbi:hypothetical protein [Microbacterium sp. GXF7504]
MTREFYYATDGSMMRLWAPTRSPRQQLVRLLGMLTPEHHSTFVLSELPEGADFVEYVHAGGNDAFLQCAGTTEAMTIEIRKRDDDGEFRLYTLGRGGDRAGQPDVAIAFDGGAHETEVYPDEVFALEEATEIFLAYYDTGTVPSQYELRPHDLTEADLA